LRCLYELLKRVPNGTKTMTNTMSRYLRTKGTAIVNENKQIQQQEVEEAVADQQNGNGPNPIMFIQARP
jgi:hypothetical protein